MQVRRDVLGAAHVDAAGAATTPLDADFQQFITRYVWGDLWARPGLEPRIRSVVTIALLAGLGRSEELALHLRASRNTGTKQSDITEVLMHVAVYAGIPAANAAFTLAKQIFVEVDESS